MQIKPGSIKEKYRRYTGKTLTPATNIACETCGVIMPAFSKAQLKMFYKEPPKAVCAECGYFIKPRNSISDDLRRRVYAADRHECVYCGATNHLTLDHIVPYSQGGRTDFDNLLTCCDNCNGQKSDSRAFKPPRFGRFRERKTE
jgi:hypothetical protein